MNFHGFSWIIFCQNPKAERIICSAMPQYDLVIVQFDNSFVFLWPILCTAYFCWTGSRQMGGLAELIEGEDGAYVEPFSCLAPTSVTASSVETMLMRMLASVPTQSQLGGFANREKLSRLLFDCWWEAIRFSKSNVLLLSPAFCNFSNDTLTRTIKSVEIWRSRRFRWNPFKSCGTERSAENNNWASFVSSFLWCRAVKNKS